MKIASHFHPSTFVLTSLLAFASTTSFSETATAQPTPVESKWSSATEDELSREINKLGEEIRVKVDTSIETRKILESVPTNPAYTSEAVEAKRKALKAAEDALIKAQIELRDEVSKLPEVQKLVEDDAKLQENIAALRKQNASLIKLLRSRKAGKTTND